ncbi:MAG TPA: hypothetical protein VMK66_11535 [Myxococcales bacterium]|nr:hypothetical protein [Myxococcales bacterium]
MSKTIFAAPLAVLLLAGTANAGTLQTLRLREHAQTPEQLAAEVVEVQAHRSPGAIIAQDALYGGLAGLAVGAGVALISSDGNWGRDLAIGAGVGLLVGGIYGAVDAATYADRAPVGFGNAYHLASGRF